MNDNNSSREKLLKLIDSGDTKSSAKKESRKFFLVHWFKKRKVIGSYLKERFGGLSRRSVFEQSHQGVGLVAANRMLGLILILLIGGLFQQMSFQGSNVADITSAISQISFVPIKKKIIEQFAPRDFYLNEIGGRDIFRPVIAKKTPVSSMAPSSSVSKEKIKEKIKDLTLVGISWGTIPYAIVRDRKEEKTYFVKMGELIRDVQVKTILKEKVIFGYEGEEGILER